MEQHKLHYKQGVNSWGNTNSTTKWTRGATQTPLQTGSEFVEQHKLHYKQRVNSWRNTNFTKNRKWIRGATQTLLKTGSELVEQHILHYKQGVNSWSNTNYTKTGSELVEQHKLHYKQGVNSWSNTNSTTNREWTRGATQTPLQTESELVEQHKLHYKQGVNSWSNTNSTTNREWTCVVWKHWTTQTSLQTGSELCGLEALSNTNSTTNRGWTRVVWRHWTTQTPLQTGSELVEQHKLHYKQRVNSWSNTNSTTNREWTRGATQTLLKTGSELVEQHILHYKQGVNSWSNTNCTKTGSELVEQHKLHYKQGVNSWSNTNSTTNREWTRGATQIPLQTESELVEQHKLHYKQGVNSWSNTNSTTNREWTCVVWKHWTTQTSLQTGSELLWSGSIEQHKLHYKQGVNSCGLEALNNTNSTTNREWTRGATQTPLQTESELVEQHKLHYKQGVNSWSNTNSTTNREWTCVVWKHWTTQTSLQTGSELVWSGSIEQHKLHYKQGVNSCGLEALNNTNFTTNREWTRVWSGSIEQHKLQYKQGVNSCGLEALNNTNSTTNREWTRVVWKHWATQTPLQTGGELVWSGSIEQQKLHYKQGVNSCGLEALSNTNSTTNRGWTRVVWKYWTTQTPLQTGSELVCGLEALNNTNSNTNREWTRVVWKHWTTQTPLQTGSELVWSGSIEQHKLQYKQGVNSCGLEALSNTNSTTNREWTRVVWKHWATQTPLHTGSELVWSVSIEQHKLHYKQGVNSCGLAALSNTNSTTNREWTRVVWKYWTTQTPLQTGSELVWSGSIEQHKLHYKQGVNSCGLEALNNTNFTTNKEWTRVVWKHWATQTPLHTGGELVWSGSIEQHKLHYKQGVNSCGLEALSNTNSTTNSEWTRVVWRSIAQQTPLQTGSELVWSGSLEQHKLHYKQGVNSWSNTNSTTNREWTRGAAQTPLQTGGELVEHWATQTPLQTGSELVWSGSIEQHKLHYKQGVNSCLLEAMSNTNSTTNREWTHVVWKHQQFLLYY